MKLRLPGWAWAVILTAGVTLLLSPWLRQFAFTVSAEYTDLAVTHAPNALYLRRALLEWRQVPLWSNTILGGYPFAANPLSGLWYAPTWLAALLPQPFGWNLIALLHVLLGGWGFYRLMRAERLGVPGAFSGALAFGLLPRAWAHYAAGHLTLVCAFAITPWLLLAARCATEQADTRIRLREGALLGLIVLADVRWAAYAGLAWAAYRLYLFAPACGGRAGFGRFALTSLEQAIFATLVSAPLLLPLVEYSALSTRAVMVSADNFYLSLPAARLANLLIPAADGNAEWTVYAGALPLLLAVWGMAQPGLRGKCAFWTALALFGLVFSLGAAVPGMALLANLPGFSLLRVPPRFLLLNGMALAGISAHGVAYFSEALVRSGWGAYTARLICAGLASFCLLAGLGAWLVTQQLSPGFAWAAVAMPAAAVLVFLRERGRIPARAWQWGCALLLTADMLGISLVNMRFQPAASVFAQGAAVAGYLANQSLASQAGSLRVYSPSYSLPQQTAARFGLELASGIDPLQLGSYSDAVQRASGVPRNGYGVALPPLEGDSPARANRFAVPDASALGQLNVKYIAAEFDLAGDDLVLVRRFGETRIYENRLACPRAWVEQDGQVISVDTLTWTPNEISLQAGGAGRLVLSEVAYPGWRVWVDGVEQPLLVVDGLLRGVMLAPGDHRVRFAFLPWRVFAGVALAVLGWLGFWIAERGQSHAHSH